MSIGIINKLKEIFLAGVNSVQPQNLIKNEIKVTELNGKPHLVIKFKIYPITQPCYVIGFGKGVLGMALELEKILSHNLKMGIITVPVGIFHNFPKPIAELTKIKIIEGAKNNLPDEEAMKGAIEIRNLIQNLTKNDLIIVLITGGGSALLPLPKSPITLQEKKQLIKNLAEKGADISEINCVRQKISELKGGGLAALANPAKIVSFIISDIVGDPIDLIASGPTIQNDSINPQKAIEIVRKYLNFNQISDSIKTILSSNENICKNFANADNFIIGNNQIAAEKSNQYAHSLGFQSIIVSTSIFGNVEDVAKYYANLVLKICSSKSNIDQKFANLNKNERICLIGAGEPTVVIGGNGKGGRNQHLALLFSLEISKFHLNESIWFLSCGTDGIDGPTDAAGAIGCSNLVKEGFEQGLNVQDYLENRDSYNFYSKFNNGDYWIKIGHTGTNVMDLHLILIIPKE